MNINSECNLLVFLQTLPQKSTIIYKILHNPNNTFKISHNLKSNKNFFQKNLPHGTTPVPYQNGLVATLLHGVASMLHTWVVFFFCFFCSQLDCLWVLNSKLEGLKHQCTKTSSSTNKEELVAMERWTLKKWKN